MTLEQLHAEAVATLRRIEQDKPGDRQPRQRGRYAQKPSTRSLEAQKRVVAYLARLLQPGLSEESSPEI